MGAVGVWVAEEVCECDGWEGVVVAEIRFVEFDHYVYVFDITDELMSI